MNTLLLTIALSTVSADSNKTETVMDLLAPGYFTSQEEKYRQETPAAKKQARDNLMRFVEPEDKGANTEASNGQK